MHDRYAVIGNPVEHSKSPEIHSRFAAQTGQQMVYERLLAPLDGFASSVRTFMEQGGRGLNVTVPFKLEAYALATELSDRARAAGAVNTLRFDASVLHGDNTDGVGLVRDISRNLGLDLHDKKILLLGAGGAARGVILPLLQAQPSVLVIANRTLARADELVRQFERDGNMRVASFAGVNEAFDVIINATSASLAGELPPIPAAAFMPHTLAYDMMYGKQPTVFMRFASGHGAQTSDGLGMLVEQAAESFFTWRGVRPDTGPVLTELRAALK